MFTKTHDYELQIQLIDTDMLTPRLPQINKFVVMHLTVKEMITDKYGVEMPVTHRYQISRKAAMKLMLSFDFHRIASCSRIAKVILTKEDVLAYCNL